MSKDYKSYAVNVSIPEPLKSWELESKTLKATLYMKTYESQKETDAKRLVDSLFKVPTGITIDSIVEYKE